MQEQLAKAKLLTTPYNAQQSQLEFPFINIMFTPKGRGDDEEYEGSAHDMTVLKDTPAPTHINSFPI